MKWLRSTYGTALLGIPLLVAAGPATSALALTGSWAIQPSANSMPNDALADVAALSPTNVWSVGYAFNGTYQPLIEHYNGTAWSTVPAPAPAPALRNNRLSGMTAISASDIWAVGSSPVDKLHNYTLAEHWNGTAWSVVTTGQVTPRSGLGAVSAVSSSDVWAVGSSSTSGPLAEHWNGTAWSVDSRTPVIVGSSLTGVAAVSSSNVCAVGVTSTGGFSLHYSNGQWTQVTVPAPSVAHSGWTLYDVTATSASNVWAVGSVTAPDGLSSQPVVSHFNGSSWTTITVSTRGAGYAVNGFSAVRAASPADVWAVGNAGPGNQTFVTLTEHFDGTNWTVVSSPNPAGQNSGLSGVASAGSGQWWAVGSSYPPTTGLQQTLVEHFSSPLP